MRRRDGVADPGKMASKGSLSSHRESGCGVKPKHCSRGVDDEAIRAYREARNPNIVFTADEQLTVQMGQMGGAPGLR